MLIKFYNFQFEIFINFFGKYIGCLLFAFCEFAIFYFIGRFIFAPILHHSFSEFHKLIKFLVGK
jgi:hypothetical protein